VAKKLQKYVLPSLTVLVAATVFSNSTMAAATDVESIAKETSTIQNNQIAQVTSVSQLSDVQPTDWAFQALQSLVERYGCIAGYPNGTYRGNRAMTRYEFAAGLNACLDRVNELIATATADLVTKQDLATVQRLQEEFSAELATLRGRVDALEAKTAELEANQFSTTTKLEGEVVMGLANVFSGNDDNNANFGARVRLDFVSSFTGKDELLARIEANNFLNPEIGTPEGGLAFAGENGNTNAEISSLSYSFPFGESTKVTVFANGSEVDDITDTVHALDGDGGSGALSAFGTRNPIYSQVEDGAGLVLRQEFGKSLDLTLGYLATSANNPSDKNGLFDGSYGALAQLTIKPSDKLSLGLTYINAYNQELGTGSNRANPQSFLSNPLNVNIPVDVPFSSNSYGAELSWRLSEKFVLGGWAGYTNTRNLSTAGGSVNRGTAEIWNWAVSLGFPDLGKKGNLAGIIVGMEPKVTSSSINQLDKDRDTSYHIEAFYEYKVSDNIAITPGVIWLTAPDHNKNNDGVVIGAIRTTFTF
jgi:Carbohydrate-selective porin, OprB family/S-layer homology domain